MPDPELTPEQGFDPSAIFEKVVQQPRPSLSQASRDLLRSSPEDWSVARKRMVITSIVSGDGELFETAVNEYAAVLDYNLAFQKVLGIMQEMAKIDGE